MNKIVTAIFIFIATCSIANADEVQGTIKNVMINSSGHMLLAIEFAPNDYTIVWFETSNEGKVRAAMALTAQANGSTVWVNYVKNNPNPPYTGCTNYEANHNGVFLYYSHSGWFGNKVTFMEVLK